MVTAHDPKQLYIQRKKQKYLERFLLHESDIKWKSFRIYLIFRSFAESDTNHVDVFARSCLMAKSLSESFPFIDFSPINHFQIDLIYWEIAD